MENSARQKRIGEFEERCRERGIPLTVQRRATYEALLRRTDHPTADQIYEDVRATVPGVSRMTVYRVLELLLRLRLADRVCHPGTALRFDSNCRAHHHLVCMRCNQLIDFEEATLDRLAPPSAARRIGFEILDHFVQFRGVCAKCRAQGVSDG